MENWEIVDPTVELVVCNSAPATEVTSTVVLTAPTAKVALMVRTSPTFTVWALTW